MLRWGHLAGIGANMPGGALPLVQIMIAIPALRDLLSTQIESVQLRCRL